MSKYITLLAYFILFFKSLSCDALTVQDLRMSEVGRQTRVTFILDTPQSLDLEEDLDNQRISVMPPTGTRWALKKNIKTLGFVKGYEIQNDHGKKPVLIMHVLKDTDIDDYGIRRNARGEAEFFVDLRRDLESTHEESSHSVPPQKEKLVIPETEDPVVQPIKKVRIEQSGRETIFTLETTHPISFEPELQQSNKKVMVSLPKTNWLHVDTRQKQGGLIKGYFVDDSDAGVSKLVLSLAEHVDMRIQQSRGNLDHHDYQIIFLSGHDENEGMNEKQPVEKKVLRRRKEKVLSLPMLENRSNVSNEEAPFNVPQDLKLPKTSKTLSDSLPQPLSHTEILKEEPPKKRKKRADYFRIEGEEETLDASEIREDLKGLEISLNMPDHVALVDSKDLKKDNLKEEAPKFLKKFKITPSAYHMQKTRQGGGASHRQIPNQSTVATRLQHVREPSQSHAPAWVIEAKMQEKRD